MTRPKITTEFPPREEVERNSGFRNWMEGNAGGRRLLAFLDWLHEEYHKHLQRYYFYEATWYRLGTWLAGSAVALMILAALGGTFRAVLNHHRHKLETRWQAAAQSYLEKGDYSNASLSARAALLLNSNNVTVCRVLAELCDRVHSPNALEWYARIAEYQPTVNNLIMLGAVAMNYQDPPYPITVMILDKLTPGATNRAGYQVVAASLALHTHRLVEAQKHFGEAALLEPNNELFQRCSELLATYLTNGPQPLSAIESLEQLRREESLELLVIRALVADRLIQNDPAGANEYSRKLVASPQATLADQLQHLGILQRIKTEEFNDDLKSIQRQASTNAMAVAQVSTWMQANGLVDKDLDWMTDLPVVMLDQAPIQLAQAQGYLQNSNWTALRDVASQSNWGKLEFLRLALVFRAWSQLGEMGLADVKWHSALCEAAGNREAMTQLWKLAELWQLKSERENLLLQIVQEFPKEHRAQQELEALDYNNGNTSGLHELYALLHEQFPGETGYKNDMAATALLINSDLPDNCQRAAEAYAQDPDNPAEASTYAFSLHVQGRDKQGVAVLQKFTAAELSEPSVALYYGVLLAAAGKTDQAGPWLKIAQTRGHLLPEENQLLTTALEQSKPPQP